VPFLPPNQQRQSTEGILGLEAKSFGLGLTLSGLGLDLGLEASGFGLIEIGLVALKIYSAHDIN